MEYFLLGYIGVLVTLICLQQYKWSERGIKRLFEYRKKKIWLKPETPDTMGKVLPFRPRQSNVVLFSPKDRK